MKNFLAGNFTKFPCVPTSTLRCFLTDLQPRISQSPVFLHFDVSGRLTSLMESYLSYHRYKSHMVSIVVGRFMHAWQKVSWILCCMRRFTYIILPILSTDIPMLLTFFTVIFTKKCLKLWYNLLLTLPQTLYQWSKYVLAAQNLKKPSFLTFLLHS